MVKFAKKNTGEQEAVFLHIWNFKSTMNNPTATPDPESSILDQTIDQGRTKFYEAFNEKLMDPKNEKERQIFLQ